MLFNETFINKVRTLVQLILLPAIQRILCVFSRSISNLSCASCSRFSYSAVEYLIFYKYYFRTLIVMTEFEKLYGH